ncbi:Retrovirus-related Pol poly from transposon [Labeo rohita]|uniref:Retrovirus-related Pol poly from transposon n=1 Tax=Labeo rohita TaxID=84645 RepID=A0A498M212_LABRO|nr:Retrovirus-related Pol poly from transposon [Labeo rohita]
MPSDDVNREPKAGRMDGSDRAFEDGGVDSDFNQRGNFRGGRMFRRGNPPSRRSDVPFMWSSECQAAMDFLKDRLTSAPVLKFPDFSLPFFIHADACDVGLGAALMQRDNNGRDVVVAYASRALHKAERPYSTPEKECLAVIWALEHFRPYVEGLHVTIFSDHSSLRWLMSRPNLSGRLARWALRLQDFDFDIVHRPGTSNKVPDALSRNPVLSCGAPLEVLPDYAVIGGLDLRILPPVIFSDREHLRQMQLNDPVTGRLLRMLESQDDSNGEEMSQYVIQDGLLYFVDDKVSCSLHPMKRLKLLESSLREAHDHARSILAESHAKRKKHYDRRRRPVSYCVDELGAPFQKHHLTMGMTCQMNSTLLI